MNTPPPIVVKDLIKELEERDQKIAELESKRAELESKLAEVVKENDRLRDLLEGKAQAKASRKPRFSVNYGGRSESGRTKKKGRGKGATGRRPSGDKQAFVSATEKVYPDGVAAADCIVVRTQCAWRLVEGRAVYICYEIFDRPDFSQAPLPAGLRTKVAVSVAMP